MIRKASKDGILFSLQGHISNNYHWSYKLEFVTVIEVINYLVVALISNWRHSSQENVQKA